MPSSHEVAIGIHETTEVHTRYSVLLGPLPWTQEPACWAPGEPLNPEHCSGRHCVLTFGWQPAPPAVVSFTPWPLV